VVIGRGIGIQAAVEDGLARSRAVIDEDFLLQWVKVDIIQEVFPIPVWRTPLELERSLFGLAFSKEIGQAFLPEELVAHTLVDSDLDIRWNNIEWFIENLRAPYGESAGLGTALEEAKEMYRFRSDSYFYDGQQASPLYRGHMKEISISPAALLINADQGGQYLTRSVKSDGSFVYSYYPKQDEYEPDYNILRHAGTIFAMMQLYEVNQDPALLAAAEQAVKYLIASMRICPQEDAYAICVVEGGESKLGGNGLAILALLRYMDATDSDQYISQTQDMGRWIQNVQGEDGEFKVHKQSFPGGEKIDFTSEYYPGEAIFALTQLHKIDGDESWLDTAEAAVDWLVNVRDADVSDNRLPHDHWLLYGIYELYQFRPREAHYQHAMRITKAILNAQHVNPKYPDWTGGYYSPPGSTPTATRSEALCSAYRLAVQAGQQDWAGEILEAYRRNMVFQLMTQFQPESVMYLLDPQEALGGFHSNLTNFEIRIDYVQHNVSSILCLAEILD